MTNRIAFIPFLSQVLIPSKYLVPQIPPQHLLWENPGRENSVYSNIKKEKEKKNSSFLQSVRARKNTRNNPSSMLPFNTNQKKDLKRSSELPQVSETLSRRLLFHLSRSINLNYHDS